MNMEKNIRKFIWNSKKGQLAWERVILPVKDGGLGAPSLKIRYEAIKVGWLKRWWRPEPDRPDWAWVANELVFQGAQQKPNIARPTVREWICQTWPIKIRSEQIPKSLKEMIEAAQKYNATISVTRAPRKLRLEMPAFHHPFAKNKNLRTNSRTMRCLTKNHEIKTVRNLIQMSTEEAPNHTVVCNNRKPGKDPCKEKAKELLNWIKRQWHPNKETPQRHNLWHTPKRIKRNKKVDPLAKTVTYNPDMRSTHSILEGIRIFGKLLGHKSKDRDEFVRERDPARINERIELSGWFTKLSTDGSAVKNGWENASAGIGVWYTDRSTRNITLKLESQGNKVASNSRAELGAILEALRQNKTDDIEIESDSLMSLRAICTHSDRYKDLNWTGIQNADLIKSIIIKLRMRPAQTAFKWVKGHDDNYGNNRADALADTGRNSNASLILDDDDWTNSHPAL